MTLDYRRLLSRDAEVVLHPASSISDLLRNGPKMLVNAEGCHVYDSDNTKLLDAVAGLWCVNVGYGRSEIAEIMRDCSEALAYYPTFSNATNPWQVELADKLLELSSGLFSKVFFGCSGSDANDSLIKIAWHYHALNGHPHKNKIIARDNAYHGTSVSTASLTGIPAFHRAYPLPLDFVIRTSYPNYYTQAKDGEREEAFCDRLINEVKALIQKHHAENIAAFIAEPIMAAGGIVEPPKGYYPRLRALLSDNDILLIADEVVCGFGRLGEWFASPGLAIHPDMMSMAKGLTSGYFPLSAALISEPIWDVLKNNADEIGAFYHGYTYTGHPVGTAVALANIDLLEKEDLIQRACKNGAYMHKCLRSILGEHPNVGEIRGRGLLAGIQLVENKKLNTLPEISAKMPNKIVDECRRRRLIIRPLPGVRTLAISPPLIIRPSDIDFMVDILAQSLESVYPA